MDQYKSTSRTVFLVFNMVFLIFVGILCILPFVHLLALSFSENSAVKAGRVTFWPIKPTLAAYTFAIKGGKFIPALFVSLKRVLIGVSVNLILVVITAYPLSKTKNKLLGRNIYMIFFMITMILNGGLIPTYILVVSLGLVNSIWALILPPVGSIGALPIFFMVIMMNFMRGIPQELEDAATIDGAGVFGVLFRIMLPVLKPAIATIALFSIVGHWNEWFGGMIYMQNPELYPLQTYLRTMLRGFEELLRQDGGDYTRLLELLNVRTGRSAQLFLGMIPVLMIYPFLQKYFTSGLVLGSVKG
jgi:putative aldouronate transport system permease protein